MTNTRTFSHQPMSSLFGLGLGLALVLIAMLITNTAFAANGINSNKGLAIDGYDPVAYFTESKPVKGKTQYSVEHKGNKWAFSNEKNKQAFIKNPAAFIPQYGGFCAFAASKNSIAPVDPKAWTIHNNKLYLNYSLSVRKLWMANKDANIIAADGNWPTLMKQVP